MARSASELRELFGGCDQSAVELVAPLIENAVFLESRLEELEALPFIVVNPRRPDVQRPTEAARMYQRLIGQYNLTIKTLATVQARGADAGEHPFTAWLREQQQGTNL